MDHLSQIKNTIATGKAVLGIELGSTRIKAVLIDENHAPIASGSYDWENQLVDNIWTYDLKSVWEGIQTSYANMAADAYKKYGVKIEKLAALGFSAMMHGYMVFDDKNALLVPFRTWRNTITEDASTALSALFGYPIPQRWSIAHLYQAILNGESHVKDIAFQTTLAGYVHWMLTGKKVLGVGEASGMFPIDTTTGQFDAKMLDQFDELIADRGFDWKIRDILPAVLSAGEAAGTLTADGAKLLDPTGTLAPGATLCPPEGDAGTGMTATNSVAVRTGNVSAGTSVFAMITLEKPLKKVHPELDLVTTPDGSLVAMVHCNNCSSDLDAWVSLFKEFAETMGMKIDDIGAVYAALYNKALEADADCGGLLAYNYFSGEHITGFEEGRPLFVRKPESNFNLANFMRTHIFTALGALKTGMDILMTEDVRVDKITGHGGLFKTEGVVQKFMAAAMNAPVSVLETAGEGGAWGIALLAAYAVQKGECETLSDYLDNRVFAGQTGKTITPDTETQESFALFIDRYKNGLAIERAAVEHLN